MRGAFAEDRLLQGWEVDQACRDVIVEAGDGEARFEERYLTRAVGGVFGECDWLPELM